MVCIGFNKFTRRSFLNENTKLKFITKGFILLLWFDNYDDDDDGDDTVMGGGGNDVEIYIIFGGCKKLSDSMIYPENPF